MPDEIQEKCGEDLSDEVNALWHLCWILPFLAAIVVITVWAATIFFTSAEASSIYRFYTLKIGPGAMVLFLFLLLPVLLDLVTPGKTLRCICANPIAAAIFYGLEGLGFGIAVAAVLG